MDDASSSVSRIKDCAGRVIDARKTFDEHYSEIRKVVRSNRDANNRFERLAGAMARLKRVPETLRDVSELLASLLKLQQIDVGLFRSLAEIPAIRDLDESYERALFLIAEYVEAEFGYILRAAEIDGQPELAFKVAFIKDRAASQAKAFYRAVDYRKALVDYLVGHYEGGNRDQIDKSVPERGYTTRIALRALESRAPVFIIGPPDAGDKVGSFTSLYLGESTRNLNPVFQAAIPMIPLTENYMPGEQSAIVVGRVRGDRKMSKAEQDYLVSMGSVMQSYLASREGSLASDKTHAAPPVLPAGADQEQSLTQLPVDDFEHLMPGLTDAIQEARRIATTDKPVLITGEAHAGQRQLARLVQRESHLASRPLVQLACEELSTDDCYRQFLGTPAGRHEAGPADEGYLQQAKTGTLMLFGAETLPRQVQELLVSQLSAEAVRDETRGAESTTDIRLVCTATHSPAGLRHLMQQGILTESFFKLLISGAVLEIPPLRVRPTDVQLLGEEYLRRLANERGVEPPEIDEMVWHEFARLPLEDNLESVRRFVEELLGLAQRHSGPLDYPAVCEAGLFNDSDKAAETDSQQGPKRKSRWEHYIDVFKKQLLIREIEAIRSAKTGKWKQGELKDRLGISAATITRLLREYELK